MAYRVTLYIDLILTSLLSLHNVLYLMHQHGQYLSQTCTYTERTAEVNRLQHYSQGPEKFCEFHLTFY